MPVSHSLDFRGVRFGYGPTPVLDGVDLELDPGDFAVLTGPNGSGKSTLLRLAVGLAVPSAGQIRVLGMAPTDPHARRRIGYAPQSASRPSAIPVSVLETVEAGITPRRGLLSWGTRQDRREIDRALAAVGLADLAGECLFELSGGQQQRAALARALVGDPPLVLLDEPTTGLDREFRPHLVEELIRRAQAGATIVAVSHDPEDFHPAPELILAIEDGRVRRLSHEELHEERTVRS